MRVFGIRLRRKSSYSSSRSECLDCVSAGRFGHDESPMSCGLCVEIQLDILIESHYSVLEVRPRSLTVKKAIPRKNDDASLHPLMRDTRYSERGGCRVMLLHRVPNEVRLTHICGRRLPISSSQREFGRRKSSRHRDRCRLDLNALFRDLHLRREY